MILSWSAPSFRLDGRPVLPVILGATRADWITRCSLAPTRLLREIVSYENRVRLTRVVGRALSPCILGHLSEPELADPTRGVWASGEPLVWELRQPGSLAWATYGTPGGIGPVAVELAASAILEHSGASLACWLLTEPAWDMLAGAGDSRRPRLDPAQTAANIRSWCEAVRQADPLPSPRPIVWAESSGDPGRAEGWTRTAVLRVFEGVGDAVEIHGANRYSTNFPIVAGSRAWWWKAVPGPRGLVECGWLPYAWSEATADRRRLKRAGWTLPPPSDWSYPDCEDQAGRLARWVDLAGEIASDPDCAVTGYYGGTSHGGGESDRARPWGLLAHPWGRARTSRWLPVGPIADAARRIRTRWEAR